MKYVPHHSSICVLLGTLTLSAGQDVTVWNSFEFSAPEAIVDVTETVAISDDVEFPLFPIGSFYEIDVTTETITMTLKENSEASVTVYPDGVTDRYYFDLGTEIMSADLDGTAELNEFAKVTVIPPNTEYDIANTFNVSVPLPIKVTNGGVLVEYGENSDISVLGVKLMLSYKAKDSPTSGSASRGFGVFGIGLLLGALSL